MDNLKVGTIVVTTIDNKEIKITCTKQQLEAARRAVCQLCPLSQRNDVVRLWKLGDSNKQILPTQPAVDKLLGILESAKDVPDGILDIVWDDMIDLIEYSPILPEFVYLGENFTMRVDKIESIVLYGD